MAPHLAVSPRPSVVLVVDAYPDVAESTALMLSLYGYTAHPATCGRAAVELAVRLRPDAVVLDARLPDGDGYALVRSLTAALGYHPHTVLVTGRPGLEGRSRAAGYAHLLKPADPEELAAAVGRSAGGKAFCRPGEQRERRRGVKVNPVVRPAVC